MGNYIIRVPEYPDLDALSKDELDRWGDEIAKCGIVEQITARLDVDGYTVHIDRTLWTRNKRRAQHDQRENIITVETLLTLTGHQAAYLVEDLVGVLLHVRGDGPKKEG